jgi:hypothetical protein
LKKIELEQAQQEKTLLEHTRDEEMKALFSQV